jgi:hypothetical protein
METLRRLNTAHALVHKDKNLQNRPIETYDLAIKVLELR